MVGPVVGTIYILFLIVAYVVNGIWIYRASSNAAQIDPDTRRISVGCTVGWYFIPIANLWMPFQAMKQLWNSSHGGVTGDIHASAPMLLSFWWVAWVVSSLLPDASFRIPMRNDGLETWSTTARLDVLAAPASILSAILFLKILRAVTQVQGNQSRQAEIFA